MDQCHMYPCWINHIEKGANDQALRGEHSVHALEGTAWLHTPWNGFKDRQWRSQFKFNSPQKKRIKLPFWCLILFYRTTCSRENVCKSYRALQSFFFFFTLLITNRNYICDPTWKIYFGEKTFQNKFTYTTVKYSNEMK